MYSISPEQAGTSPTPSADRPRPDGRGILRAVCAALAPGGRFVAYQFRDSVGLLRHERLGPPTVSLALLNVPPVRVYCWRKRKAG